MSSREALEIAKQEGLDLVLVSASSSPPVCRVIDYGRHKYEEGKLGKDKKPKQQEVKVIRLSPRIAEHDISFLIRNTIKFLEEGCKVKVICKFMRRELAHPEQGRMKLDLFAERVKEHGTVERAPVLEGVQMSMIVLPIKGATGSKKHAKDQDKQDSGQEVQNLGNREDSASEVA